jgi:transposase
VELEIRAPRNRSLIIRTVLAYSACGAGRTDTSRGGLTTKVVALVDALGNLARFILLPGQRHDSVGVAPLILEFAALIADKAFDNNALRTKLIERSALAVIPSKADRKASIPHDVEMYKWRHLVENRR